MSNLIVYWGVTFGDPDEKLLRRLLHENLEMLAV